MDISLVIPLFNESERIGILKEGLARFVNEQKNLSLEIIFVDDGSTDKTPPLLNELKASLTDSGGTPPDIRIINISHAGKGAALKAGVMAAKGDSLLTLDADLSVSPLQLLNWQKDRLLNLGMEAEKRDTVYIGSREHPDSRVTYRPIRKVLGLVFNLIVQIFLGLDISDTQCGFKLYPSPIAKKLFGNLKDSGWAHDTEILKRARESNIKLVELPVRWIERKGNKIRLFEKIGVYFKYAVYAFFSLLLIYTAYIMVMLHPYEYVYYNQLAGGVKGAEGRYELDYWATSYKEAAKILTEYINKKDSPNINHTLYVCGPDTSIKPFLPANVKLISEIDKADYFVGFTKWSCHEHGRGKIIGKVERMGATLALIKTQKRL